MDINKLNSSLNKLNKILFVMLVAALIVWAGLSLFIDNKKEQLKNNVCSSNKVVKILEKLNANLPSSLQEKMILEKISCEAQKFIYDVKIEANLADMAELTQKDKDEMWRDEHDAVKELFCKDARAASLREYAQGIEYRYRLLSGKEFLNVRVTKNECE